MRETRANFSFIESSNLAQIFGMLGNALMSGFLGRLN